MRYIISGQRDLPVALIFLMIILTGGLSACSAGRTLVFLGDSNIWYGGDDCSGERSWNHWLLEMNPGDTGRSFARSGATWTNTAHTAVDTRHYSQVLNDTNVIYNQVKRLEESVRDGEIHPDVVYISAGINDAWFADRRPGIYSMDPSELLAEKSKEGCNMPSAPSEAVSLAESVDLALTELRRFLPERTRIVVVTPARCLKGRQDDFLKVCGIMAEVAAVNGADVVRIDRDLPVDLKRDAADHYFTFDGVHTTPEAAKEIARKVNRQLASDGKIK